MEQAANLITCNVKTCNHIKKEKQCMHVVGQRGKTQDLDKYEIL